MRRAALLTVAAWIAAAPGAQGQRPPAHPSLLRFADFALELPEVEAHRVRLAEGPTLYLFEDPALPLIQIAAAARVGIYLDPPGQAGLARLTGAMMRRGGAGDWSADELDRRVDALGARIDTGIGETRGGASLSATSWTFAEALELWVEALARPRFQEDRLATARANALEGLSRRNDDPLDLLEREWQLLLFGPDHYSTRSPTPESLAAIERRDLVAFHGRHFRPEALVLAVSGDFDRSRLLSELRRAFGAWSVPAGQEPNPWPPPAPRHRPQPGLYLADFDTPQAKVLLGHLANPGERWSEREEVALSLVNELLGGSDAISRIPGRLRAAEGLVYRADAAFDLGRPWPRDFRVFFETSGPQVGRAIRLAREEIDRLRSEPPHPRELQAVQRAARSSLRLAFDTAEKIAGWYAEDELLGRPHSFWERRHQLLGEIRGEEVRRAARRWLDPERLVYLVVGRTAELGDLAAATGHPPVLLPARDPLTLEPVASDAPEHRPDPAAPGSPAQPSPGVRR